MNRNVPKHRPTPGGRRRPTSPIGILIVVAIVGFVLAKPWLEKEFGWKLPSISSSDRNAIPAPPPDVMTSGRSDRRDAEPALREIRRDVFQSPAGLVYTPGSRHQHRLKHVMAHTRDEPDRPGPHGVFDAKDQAAVVALIDEAYEEARQGRADSSGSDSERQVWTVDMGRDIGYVGGQVGQQRNHPRCRQLRMVLDGTRVITAYPVR